MTQPQAHPSKPAWSPSPCGVESAIRSRLQKGGKAFAPFLTAGFPDEAGFVEALRAAQNCEADIVEVGVPFSDPIADGPTIQYASQLALEQKMTLDRALDLICRADLSVPVVLMSYLNPLLSYGCRRLVQNVRKSGVYGIIIPDLAFDPYSASSSNGQAQNEPDQVAPRLRAAGLDLILLAAPTTQPARLATIGRRTQGFLYAVTLTGVTGARTGVEKTTIDFLRRAKATTRQPVLAGFGISNAQAAATVAAHCDGVIVGSALIDVLRQRPRRTALRRLEKLLLALRRGLDGKNGG